MTGKKRAAAAERPLVVEANKGESEQATMARVTIEPFLRHGVVANGVKGKMLGDLPGKPDFGDYSLALKHKADAAKNGDLGLATDLLLSQALSLDALFTELARRATLNMGDYPQAAERYARLAFRAQANSRSTVDSLLRLHQPHEQTVKHVHVNQGGQAVVADHFHQDRGGKENGESGEQCHAPGAACEGPALPCPDSVGIAVPVPSRERETPMQNARRNQPRGAEGQS